MTRTAQVLPYVSNDTSLPQLDWDTLPESAKAFEFRFEPDLAQFCFDQGPAPYANRNPASSFVLDTAGKDTNLISASAGDYVVFAPGQNGLITNVPDSAIMTIGGIFNYREPDPATARAVLMGSAEGSVLSSAGGVLLEIRDTGAIGAYSNGLPMSGGSWSITQENLESAGVVRGNNNFVFVAMTLGDAGGGETTNRLYVRGSDGFLSASRIGEKVVSDNNIAIGNAYMTGVWDETATRCAYAFAGGVTYSEAQLEALYQRSKIIAQRRGVTVF